MGKTVLGEMLQSAFGNKPALPIKELPPVEVTTTLKLEGNKLEEWKSFLYEYDDVFDDFHIGGSAELISRDQQKGLLIRELDMGDEDDLDSAIRAWRSGEKLPDGYYAIDDQIVLQTFVAGVVKLGMDWQNADDCDGPFMAGLILTVLGLE